MKVNEVNSKKEVADAAEVWERYWHRQQKKKKLPLDSYTYYLWEGHLRCIVPALRKLPKNPIGLEVGVGSGVLLEEICKKVQVSVVGLDISPASICRTKHFTRRSIPILGDVFQLPFRDDTFDFIICLGLIEHFTDSITPMLKILRLVRKGGYIFVSVPQRRSLYTPWKRWQMIKEIYPFGFEKEFSKNELEDLCETVGLTEFKIVGLDFYPSFLKILPFEPLLRPIIVKITQWLETIASCRSKLAHMLMIIARRNY